MKGLIFSDVHGDASTAGMRRIDDIEQAYSNIVSLAVQHKVDKVFCLGDLADPDCGSILVRVLDATFELVYKLHASLTGIETIFVAGNHDVIEDGSGISTLHPLRHVARVHEKPGLQVIDGFTMAFLPYPSRTMMYDPVKVIEIPRPIDAVFGHCTALRGVRSGSESSDLARGGDLNFPIDECIRSGVDKMFNGHWHHQQTTSDGVWIPGSLERLRFDEETNQPGILLFEL